MSEVIAHIREELNQTMKDASAACNFMQKYSPIYVQRQITQTLSQVFPSKDVLWRLNWFNEVKMPLLNAFIIGDDGEHKLE